MTHNSSQTTQNSSSPFSLPPIVSGFLQGLARLGNVGGAHGSSSVSFQHTKDQSLKDDNANVSVVEKRSFNFGFQNTGNPSGTNKAEGVTRADIQKITDGIKSLTAMAEATQISVEEVKKNQERDSERIHQLEKGQADQKKSIERLQESVSEHGRAIIGQNRDLVQVSESVKKNANDISEIIKRLSQQEASQGNIPITITNKTLVRTTGQPSSEPNPHSSRWKGRRQPTSIEVHSESKATVGTTSNDQTLAEKSTNKTENPGMGEGKNGTACMSLRFNYSHTKTIASQGCDPFVNKSPSPSYLTGYLLGGLIGYAGIYVLALNIGTFIINFFTKEELNTKGNVNSQKYEVNEVKIISILENPIEKDVVDCPKKDSIQKR